MTLPAPKGGSNREYKAGLHSGAVLPTRLGKPISAGVAESELETTVNSYFTLDNLHSANDRILQFLASKPGRVLSRDDIIDAALGRDANVFDRTIDVHITAIRRKLGRASEQIETIRGFGYKFRDVVPAPAG